MSRSDRTTSTISGRPLGRTELRRIDAWWRAANYLSVGQIYLMDNPLLREPLAPEHVKPRLLGHWGTTPGLNFLYAHLNRAIMARDLDDDLRHRPRARRSRPGRVRVAGGHLLRGLPRHHAGRRGHAPAVPRSSPSPAASPATWRPRPPGRSTRAASSATPSPTRTAPRSTTRTWWSRPSSATARRRPVRWRRAGTRTSSSTRAATGPCCRSCTSTATRSPTRRCSPGSPRSELLSLMRGYGHTPYVVAGSDPAEMHQAFAATLDHCLDEIRDIQQEARGAGRRPPRAPALADDRAALPEGLDRPQGGRRQADRGELAVPPGAVRGRPRQRRAPGGPGRLDAQLQARGALRRRTAHRSRTSRTCTRPVSAG